MPGKLYIVATPIGNLGDLTARTREILSSVDFIAAEDTRVAGRLLSLMNVEPKPRFIRSDEFQERRAAPVIVSRLEDGENGAMIADAGSPLVSDPGYIVIQAVLEAGIELIAIPGPSAPILALQLSGLPSHNFTFLGFFPKKMGARRRLLEDVKSLPHSLIFFVSPYRLASSLQEMYDVFGSRKAAVAIEITKKFERCYRDRLENLVEQFADQRPKGEITLVVEGAVRK